MAKPGRPRSIMRTRSGSRIRTRSSTATSCTSWQPKGLLTVRHVKSRLGKNKLHKKNTGSHMPLRYTHIERNEFVHRGHKQQSEDDIPVCACKYEDGDLETACGDQCLNFLTSTECTPGYCPCGEFCRNQRFQRKLYIKTRLVKTSERGWGLLADQDMKAGEFVIEYCGETISSEEARARSQAYEAEGLKDAYIISLSRSECIDATKKGSLARFINHSCEPNCETRKWTVLGEVRVGIFAKQDIDAGTELTYNYNFEWYGGAKVRCRCGAKSCMGFLGAKSRGFQKDAYVWEDNDDRYCVENIPLYDSEDDEPLSNFLRRAQVCNKLKKAGSKSTAVKTETSLTLSDAAEEIPLVVSEVEPIPLLAERNEEQLTLSVCPENTSLQEGKVKSNAVVDGGSDMASRSSEKMPPLLGTIEISRQEESPDGDVDATDTEKKQTVAVVDGEKKYGKNHLDFPHKRSRFLLAQQSRNLVNKHISVQSVSRFLLSKSACEEVSAAEAAEAAASADLEKVYEELQPAVKERGKDGQDGLPVALAEKWIAATCKQLKASFDFHFSVVKQLSCVTPVLLGLEMPSLAANGHLPMNSDT